MIRFSRVYVAAGLVVLTGNAKPSEVLSRAEVRAAPQPVVAGGRVPVGIRFTMAPGWHTYAEDPGDSGMPPEITIKGPEGVRLEKWTFPPPKRFTDAAGTTFGYENEVVLISAAHLPAALPPDKPLDLELHVAWMICKDTCVLFEETLRLRLTAPLSPPAVSFAEWERFLEAGGWSACVETKKKGETPAKKEGTK